MKHCEPCGSPVKIEGKTTPQNALEIAVEALKFYASASMWNATTHESTRDGVCCSDFDTFKSVAMGPSQCGGKRAREALKAIEELKESDPNYKPTKMSDEELYELSQEVEPEKDAASYRCGFREAEKRILSRRDL